VHKLHIDKSTIIGNMIAAQLREIDPKLHDEVTLQLKVTMMLKEGRDKISE